jgi:hypothetical protein
MLNLKFNKYISIVFRGLLRFSSDSRSPNPIPSALSSPPRAAVVVAGRPSGPVPSPVGAAPLRPHACGGPPPPPPPARKPNPLPCALCEKREGGR